MKILLIFIYLFFYYYLIIIHFYIEFLIGFILSLTKINLLKVDKILIVNL
jgi:hypothetical protein